MVPTHLRYAQTHEWALLDGDTCTIGITQFAVDQLTDVVYLEIKKSLGETIEQGEEFGEIESVKAVSGLYAPVSGTLTAINQQLVADPASITADPYGAGWIIKLKLAPGATLEHLLSPQQYEQQIAAQGH
ncbi:MAG: glycine cleavage system protein GcvH [Gemmataceae bacterium]|nr:glycine cleavage system protein GcvH [Gemmataceae bacterium]